MTKFFDTIDKKRKALAVLVHLYIVFYGCFGFPFDFSDLGGRLLVFSAAFVIGLAFAVTYKGKPLRILGTTFVLTFAGLLCRLVLEWGEYSVARYFTASNVVSFLLFVPIAVTVSYLVVPIIFSDITMVK